MRRLRFAFAGGLLYLAQAGCGLIPPLFYDYSFDAQQVMQSLGDGSGSSQALPSTPCTAGMQPDVCAQLATQIPPNSGSLTCEGGMCVATAHVRAPIPVDLRQAKTPVPDGVAQFAIDRVTVAKVAYWVVSNSINIDTPNIDLFVGPDSATDEMSPGAVKLGTVASLPAKSKVCGDAKDTAEPANQQGHTVCNMPLTEAGQNALAGFIKNYKQAPFKLLVHATIRATGGTPTPSGAIDLFVRPTVRFHILR
jgi:hypothetical protein